MFDPNDFLERAEAAGCMVKAFAKRGKIVLAFSYDRACVDENKVGRLLSLHSTQITLAQSRKQNNGFLAKLGIGEHLIPIEAIAPGAS